jgi:hypothetical protein
VRRFARNYSTSKSMKEWRSISGGLRIWRPRTEFRRGKFKTCRLSTLPKKLSFETCAGD